MGLGLETCFCDLGCVNSNRLLLSFPCIFKTGVKIVLTHKCVLRIKEEIACKDLSNLSIVVLPKCELMATWF